MRVVSRNRRLAHVGTFRVIHGFRLLWVFNMHTAGLMRI